MGKRILLTIFIMLFTTTILLPQQVITLKDCYEKALENHPLAADKTAYKEMWQNKDNNLESGWYPTLDLNGSFVYNSEVIDMSSAFASIPIPGFADNIKSMPNEQYRITADINQVIYDGGAIRNARKLEEANLSVNEQQTEAEIYKIKAQINRLYFNLLLLKKQSELLDIYLSETDKKLLALNSAVKNGVRLQSDIDIFTSERIKLEQQIAENKIKRTALLGILSDITGIEIAGDESLKMPEVATALPDEIIRPELKLFDLTKEQLGASERILNSKRLPKAVGFATLGYGNPPGNNFFKDQFSPYYIFGAGLKWNIYDWNKIKNEKQVITIQKGLVDSKKKDLTTTLQRQLDSKKAEIDALIALIARDPELISLRNRISSAAASQFENGTITSTEYLSEVNAERQAEINNEIHKISLALAKIEYYNITGKEIE